MPNLQQYDYSQFDKPNVAQKLETSILKKGTKMFSDWVKLVEQISKLRELTDHGHWKRYVEERLPWSKSTIARWLAVKKYMDSKSPNLGLLNYPSVQALSEENASDEIIQRVLEKATAIGKSPTKKETIEIIESFEIEEDEELEEEEAEATIPTIAISTTRKKKKKKTKTQTPTMMPDLDEFIEQFCASLSETNEKLESLIGNIKHVQAEFTIEQLTLYLNELIENATKLKEEIENESGGEEETD